MNKKERKEALRKMLLKRRGSIPEKEYRKKSARITERLNELVPFKQAKTVHCYVSMNARREVNTQSFIEEMLAAGKNVVVPVTQFQSETLQHIELKSIDDLETNKWGVPEPTVGAEISVNELDLVIVPMLGGDRRKNRIGYGKGFYDRFLQKINCTTIGLLFEQCLVDKIPVESFDVPLGILVTENEYIL